MDKPKKSKKDDDKKKEKKSKDKDKYKEDGKSRSRSKSEKKSKSKDKDPTKKSRSDSKKKKNVEETELATHKNGDMEFDNQGTTNFGNNKVHPGKKSKDRMEKVYNLDTARSKDSNENEDANLLH
jgi:hypothetical protein